MKAIRKGDLLMLLDYYLKDHEWIGEQEIEVLIDTYGSELRIDSSVRTNIAMHTPYRNPRLNFIEEDMKKEKAE